jgi:biopolymer transport protein ExbD
MRKRFLSENAEDVIQEESLLNLTPLIDVVFVLLITFILIAPILKFDRIELAPAAAIEKKETSLPAQGRNSITIRVFDNNSITINNRPITEKDVLTILLSLKKNHPTETPLLFQDKNATFGTYQMIKNAVESAGFEQMDVFLKP